MAAIGVLDWHTRRLLRHHGLPDIPEVRLLLRAAWLKGFTFGAAPGEQRMRAIRENAVLALVRGTAGQADEDLSRWK